MITFLSTSRSIRAQGFDKAGKIIIEIYKNDLIKCADKYILISTKEKEETRMHSYSRSFFTEKRAEAYIEELKNQGITDIELWQDRDGFGQHRYIVMWNID